MNHTTVLAMLRLIPPHQPDTPTDRDEDEFLRALILIMLNFFTLFEAAITESAREALEHFRFLALEMARMIPLGLVQGVSEQDWWKMKEYIVKTVNTKLEWEDKEVLALEKGRTPHRYRRCFKYRDWVSQRDNTWIWEHETFPEHWAWLGEGGSE